MTLHPRRGTFFVPLLAADVAPGRHVLLDVETDDMCAGGRHSVVRHRQLAFVLPRGGTVAGGNVSITEQCGLAISEFGLRERYAEPQARPGTAGKLTAAVDLGTKLRSGAKELDYTVTLTNPTARSVRLAPCPGYTEAVYVRGLIVHRSFALNCASVHVIPAHGKARFAMRLPLHPLRAGRMPVKFGWSLDTPNGPFVGKGLLVGS